jgi:hypothetical protein
MEQTSVTATDYARYLDKVPLASVSDLMEECRRRAAVWCDMAAGLEARAITSKT